MPSKKPYSSAPRRMTPGWTADYFTPSTHTAPFFLYVPAWLLALDLLKRCGLLDSTIQLHVVLGSVVLHLHETLFLYKNLYLCITSSRPILALFTPSYEPFFLMIPRCNGKSSLRLSSLLPLALPKASRSCSGEPALSLGMSSSRHCLTGNSRGPIDCSVALGGPLLQS